MKRVLFTAICITFWSTAGSAAPPMVVQAVPDSGETDVDPKLKEIRVTFDQPMNQGGMSVVGGGENFPEMLGRPRWVTARTLLMRVKLQPNHDYWLSMNSDRFQDFKNKAGESAVPYPIEFRTGAGQSRDDGHSSNIASDATPHGSSNDSSPGSLTSYPIRINPDESREFSSLAVDFANLQLRGDGITVVPIYAAPGITGAVLIGDGEYNYTPEAGESFTGHFYAAMLRFNPEDAESIIKLSAGKPVEDQGATAMARALLAVAFRRCYHRGNEALIPPEGAFAADVFSRELGEVLFSVGENSAVVYNFTDRKMLYEAK